MYAYDIGLGYAPRGLGDDTSSFDFGTALGTSSVWLLVGGGLFLWWMLAGSETAKERSGQLRSARARYQREVSGIKGQYTRTRRRKSGKGIMSKYKEGDIGPSGRVWFKGAWRKPENVYGLEED